MNKDKLILKDGSTIELEAGASLTALQVICQSADDVIPLWKRLTQENLQEITVKNGADLIVGVYSEMVLIEPHIKATGRWHREGSLRFTGENCRREASGCLGRGTGDTGWSHQRSWRGDK